ncbi:Glutamyl-tRNA(Gln) amidotransferase subunit A [Arthrobacter saudimassiliensis]|uniref:Glutamyl-tRNA(Gln) amidotransferase subunit A n=1 Tax=Arthrobacter saudimassiliensis TaxID=1461584 RepID=A0A078MP24_9MICC|nr:Glutamyl-tRNA(Gln) amidotransferase subunit A [Arthrobacter saudimassiliensis]
MAELHRLTALQLRDELAAGRVGAVETAEHFLARIADLNPLLGAFLRVTPEAALDAARAADARRAAGGDLPPLHGLPLAHKDLTDVAGVPTTMGSAAVDAWVPKADAPLPAVLRRAGALSLGKTQVPEFGLSSYSENLVGPPARNPYATDRSPGGSSGGSAAAVAAGLLPFAPGTDGGGSIRIPAAATGIIGLKPSRGRVPSGSGQSDLGQFVVAGPLARTAADAALMLDALIDEPLHRATAAPPDPQLDGPATAPNHGPYLSAALRAEGRYRIGVSTASPFASRLDIRLEDEALDALAAGEAALRAAGHTVDEAALRYDARYPDAFGLVWTAALANLPLGPGREEDLTPLTAVMRRRDLQRSAADLADAVDVLRRFEEDTIRAFSDWDMILTPTLAMEPRPIGWYGTDADEDYARQCLYSPFTSLVNVCGLPAVSLPVHRTAAGLPMGVQLIGRPGAEASLLAVAAQLEAAGNYIGGPPAPFSA